MIEVLDKVIDANDCNIHLLHFFWKGLNRVAAVIDNASTTVSTHSSVTTSRDSGHQMKDLAFGQSCSGILIIKWYKDNRYRKQVDQRRSSTNMLYVAFGSIQKAGVFRHLYSRLFMTLQ
jgi:hypothetical protein